MVVDDACGSGEHHHPHRKGTRPKSAAIYATNEVSISIIASTYLCRIHSLDHGWRYVG